MAITVTYHVVYAAISSKQNVSIKAIQPIKVKHSASCSMTFFIKQSFISILQILRKEKGTDINKRIVEILQGA